MYVVCFFLPQPAPPAAPPTPFPPLLPDNVVTPYGGVGASHVLPLHYECQGIVFRTNAQGVEECYLKSDDLSSLKHYDDRYVRDNLAAPEVAGDYVRRATPTPSNPQNNVCFQA